MLSGQSLVYECSDSQDLIPESLDPDSNGKLEITCIDGSFEIPATLASSQCIDAQSATPNYIACNAPPAPPDNSKLSRVVTEKTKFRADEKVYYVCENKEAVILPNGTNMFEIACPNPIGVHYDFNPSAIVWPSCTLEATCDNLPNPPASTFLIRATKGDSVRLGDHVVYECKDKAKYWETPNYVSMQNFSLEYRAQISHQ